MVSRAKVEMRFWILFVAFILAEIIHLAESQCRRCDQSITGKAIIYNYLPAIEGAIKDFRGFEELCKINLLVDFLRSVRVNKQSCFNIPLNCNPLISTLVFNLIK